MSIFIVQKLNFGIPFVDHVAKKTYVKTKSNKLKQLDKIDKQCLEELEYDEEEYQRLLEEFGE